jgi:hypothetical protein
MIFSKGEMIYEGSFNYFSVVFLTWAQSGYDFIPLHRSLAPVQCLINDAKVSPSKTNQFTVSISPVVRVSAIGMDLELRAVNKEEIEFKDLVPGLFRGRYTKDDYGYVFIQKVQGYTIIHFMNNTLYKDFIKEIINIIFCPSYLLQFFKRKQYMV